MPVIQHTAEPSPASSTTGSRASSRTRTPSALSQQVTAVAENEHARRRQTELQRANRVSRIVAPTSNDVLRAQVQASLELRTENEETSTFSGDISFQTSVHGNPASTPTRPPGARQEMWMTMNEAIGGSSPTVAEYPFCPGFRPFRTGHSPAMQRSSSLPSTAPFFDTPSTPHSHSSHSGRASSVGLHTPASPLHPPSLAESMSSVDTDEENDSPQAVAATFVKTKKKRLRLRDFDDLTSTFISQAVPEYLFLLVTVDAFDVDYKCASQAFKVVVSERPLTTKEVIPNMEVIRVIHNRGGTYRNNCAKMVAPYMLSYFGFAHGKKSENLSIYEELTTENSYVHKTRQPDLGPYQSRIISDFVIDRLSEKTGKIGWKSLTIWSRKVDSFKQIPLGFIAFAATVIRKCIDEWATGEKTTVEFEEDEYEGVFKTHLTNLVNFSNNPMLAPHLNVFLQELGAHAQDILKPQASSRTSRSRGVRVVSRTRTTLFTAEDFARRQPSTSSSFEASSPQPVWTMPAGSSDTGSESPRPKAPSIGEATHGFHDPFGFDASQFDPSFTFDAAMPLPQPWTFDFSGVSPDLPAFGSC